MKNRNESFAVLLKNLDLTPTQIKIYLSVLKNGISTVLDIAKDTKITRSQIYADGNILIEKGFLELAAKRKRKFLAVRPENLAKKVLDKQEEVKKLLEILPIAEKEYDRQNKNQDKKDFEIKIYEGMNEVKKVLENILIDLKDEEMCTLIGDPKALYNTVGEHYFDKKLELQKMKIHIRGVRNFKITTNIDIWKDNVLILKNEGRPSAILITSHSVYHSYGQIFEEIWSKAGEE